MYLQQFLGMLDEENPGYFDLVKYFQDPDPDVEIFIFAEKEGVKNILLPTGTWSPLFDKVFKCVFVVPFGFHENIAATLWGFHNKQSGCDNRYKKEVFSGQYLENDLGWYITTIKSIAAQSYCIETSNTYVFDEFLIRHI
jgi:hypothetical protein